jgi:hypothetical protein
MINKECIFKFRLRLSKNAGTTRREMRDMFINALPASGLRVALNNIRPRFSLGPAAADDEASNCEYADICLAKYARAEEINLKLAPFITGGFKLESVREVPFGISAVENLAVFAKYVITGVKGGAEKIKDNQKIEYEAVHPNGFREFKNIRPAIYNISDIAGGMGIIIRLDALRSIGMRKILTILPGLEVQGREPQILRCALLWQNAAGALEAMQES